MALVELVHGSHGVSTFTLNDPERRNAMGLAMAAEFKNRVAELVERPGLRVVVLTGSPGAFSAGGDLDMLRNKPSLTAAENRQAMLEFYDSFLSILTIPCPLIAVLNGHAIGAGFCLALACDIRIASSTARVGFPFARLGLHPGMGATYLVPRCAGYATAMELLATGRIITTDEAHRLRLVHSVAGDDDLANCTSQVVNELLQGGPQALAGLLATLRPERDPLQQALVREAEEQSRNYSGAEFREGLAAALEKRSPRF